MPRAVRSLTVFVDDLPYTIRFMGSIEVERMWDGNTTAIRLCTEQSVLISVEVNEAVLEGRRLAAAEHKRRLEENFASVNRFWGTGRNNA